MIWHTRYRSENDGDISETKSLCDFSSSIPSDLKARASLLDDERDDHFAVYSKANSARLFVL